MFLVVLHTALLAAGLSLPEAPQHPPVTLIVRVTSDGEPVAQATVQVGSQSALTDDKGEARLLVTDGPVLLRVERFGFKPRLVNIEGAAFRPPKATLPPGLPSEIREAVELEPEAVHSEDVVVTATRTNQRIQDLPLRVEVVPQEEIDEKLSMTPGDVAMLLTETNGLRVQVTSAATGAANVRVQGLRGRYTQILSDGLPLYGQAGSLSVLQIPPMDLSQVEMIKGVASALYGSSAVGGVINLVSRRPRAGAPEREVLFNRTSLGGTDGAIWLSEKLNSNWGYTFLGGTHFQTVEDVNGDGWSDVPDYERVVARPRLVWEGAEGRSVFMTVGTMLEDRDGGTLDGALAPDGRPFPQTLTSRSIDAGVVGRFPLSASRVFTVRSSGVLTSHDHRFGDSRERDRHHTWFGEASLNGAARDHTWVVGAALQQDGYRAQDLPGFDYSYLVPSAFVQDDWAPTPWLSTSVSGRLDVHSEFGAFFSPRLSILARPATGWSARLSTGTGFYAPTPFLDEVDDIGLSRLAPLGELRAERARSISADVSWKKAPLELTGTVFRTQIDHVLQLHEDAANTRTPLAIVNAAIPGKNTGTELIARIHQGPLDLILTHMYVWATEPDPQTGIRRELPLNPRHSAGIDLLWEIEGRARLGLEAFYTGRQRLDDSPYLSESVPYWLFGVIGEWRTGPARIFLNAENLAGFRQTGRVPIVLPARGIDGRWLDDEWGPLDGTVVNAGLRFRF
jgi:iron complex outermembrane receptor protein